MNPAALACASDSSNRIDKKFYQPATIERWVVVIYEREQRFRRQNAEEMVAGFVSMFRAVGSCHHAMLPSCSEC